jgi:outer membrane protein
MNKLIPHLAIAAALVLAQPMARAQSDLRIFVVDMNKLYENHYKTTEERAKLETYSQQARQQLDQMKKDRDALAQQVQSLDDQVKNPAASSDAQAQARRDEQAKYTELQSKTTDLEQFYNDTQRSLQAQIQNFHDGLMDDISRIATEVAKRHGATLLLDKSGRLLISGAPALVFVDPSYDITDEVQAEITKDRPATPVPAAAPASAAPGTAPTEPASGAITVPNVTPGNN